jgi:uncharacterized membrane protein
MKKSKGILWTIIILGLIGLLTSIYLTKDHLDLTSSGSICDVTDVISCSLVNSSSYSEIFNIPVAWLGVIWFIFLIYFTYKAIKDKTIIPTLLYWNILGILFVLYFITAEIILRAICPFCTVVHIITAITLVLSILLFKAHKTKFDLKSFIKKSKLWLIILIVLGILSLIYFNLPQSEKVDYEQLAKCVTEKGINMYGSFRCGVCAKTRDMYGDAFEFINEIECHPQGENPQTERCLEKGIEGTPTWVMEPNGVEEKRYQGFLSADEMMEFSGCEVNDAS